jgi:hypothetical protein
MRILLPRRTDRVAMTKQAFIAMNVFGDRFAHMIAAPRSGIDRLLLGVRQVSHKKAQKAHKNHLCLLCLFVAIFKLHPWLNTVSLRS